MVTARELMPPAGLDPTAYYPASQLAALETSQKSVTPSRPVAHYATLFDDALSSQKSGDYQHAISLYTEAIQLNPLLASAYVNRGVAHQNMGAIGPALQDYNAALDLKPISEAYNNRGNVFFKEGDYDRAATDFMNALELDQGNAFAHFGQALVFDGKGERDLAFDCLDKALRLDPDFSFALAARASLHLENGNLDRAIQDFDKLLGLEPKNTNAYNERGVAYERKGDLARAMQDYDRALSIRPNELAFANRGIGSLRQSPWVKARADLLSANNMGLNLVSVFRDSQGGVAAFEKAHGVKLPQDIADMLSIEEDPQSGPTGESLLEMFDRIRETVPDEAWDNLPTDGAKNYKHYLYGWPKR